MTKQPKEANARQMIVKEDARVAKTKEKLFSAFRELLAEKRFEDITIQEICAHADVRRATFYKHFDDKYAFLGAMTKSIIKRFDAWMSRSRLKGYPIEYHIEYQRRLVRFLVENEEIVELVLKSDMMPNMINIIVHENYKVLIERLQHSVENGERLIAPISSVATMLAGGIGNVIIRWFVDGKPTTEQELNSELECIIRAMFVK